MCAPFYLYFWQIPFILSTVFTASCRLNCSEKLVPYFSDNKILPFFKNKPNAPDQPVLTPITHLSEPPNFYLNGQVLQKTTQKPLKKTLDITQSSPSKKRFYLAGQLRLIDGNMQGFIKDEKNKSLLLTVRYNPYPKKGRVYTIIESNILHEEIWPNAPQFKYQITYFQALLLKFCIVYFAFISLTSFIYWPIGRITVGLFWLFFIALLGWRNNIQTARKTVIQRSAGPKNSSGSYDYLLLRFGESFLAIFYGLYHILEGAHLLEKDRYTLQYTNLSNPPTRIIYACTAILFGLIAFTEYVLEAWLAWRIFKDELWITQLENRINQQRLKSPLPKKETVVDFEAFPNISKSLIYISN